MSVFGPHKPSRKLVDESDRFDEEVALDEMQVIQDYMHALLKRVCGENSPDHQAAVQSLPPLAAHTAHSLPPLAELTARSKPPESIDWASMRELANSQTRAVLDTHQKIRLSNSILNNGAAGLACLTGHCIDLRSRPRPGDAHWRNDWCGREHLFSVQVISVGPCFVELAIDYNRLAEVRAKLRTTEEQIDLNECPFLLVGNVSGLDLEHRTGSSHVAGSNPRGLFISVAGPGFFMRCYRAATVAIRKARALSCPAYRTLAIPPGKGLSSFKNGSTN